MSFSPLDNHEGESPMANLPRVTMCLDKEFQEEFKEELPGHSKSENMKVFARVRPMLQREEDEGYRDCVSAIDDQTVRAIVPANSVKFKNSGLNPQDVYDFTYTQAFGPDVGQFVFFENTIMDTMLGYVEGQNCLIFNYGITNSGKTYTLQGDESNPGIIPLAMHLYFGCIEGQLMGEICVKPEKYSDITVLKDSEQDKEYRLKDELLRLVDHDPFNKKSQSHTSVVNNSTTKSFSQILCECFRDDFKYETHTTLPADEMAAAQSALYMRQQCKKSVDEQVGKVSIWVSFIEVYNEYVYDLLQPKITQRQKLSFAEDKNGDVYVKGANEIYVSNSMEAIILLYVGRRNLRIASTKLNYQSSRSHCIFTVKTVRVFDDECGTSGRVNRICFCDLAGSERATKSQTSGMRLKEAGYINASLMVLGRCLAQLRLNQTARVKKMIPFRESKLTRLFSNHFHGKGKVVMIANASPCEYTFDETLNVLRFSALAKNLTINDKYLSTAHSFIINIRNQWSKSKGRASDASLDESSELDSSMAEELEKRNEMIKELINLGESLRENLEQERKEKRELEFKIRQDVCNEYALFTDELLDDQKKNFKTQIDNLKDIYKHRFNTTKATLEKRLQELQEEFSESDGSFEISVNKADKTFDKMEQSITSSPAVGQLLNQDVKEGGEKAPVTVNTSMDCFDAVSEEENAKINSDILSLKEELANVTKKLDTTKQKLEKTITSLKESQTEEAITKEECDDLSCKLLGANEVLEEYEKAFEHLRANCLSCQDEIDSLFKEKNDLQDNLLSLSEQLAQSATEVKQLKEEKLEMEKKYSERLAERERTEGEKFDAEKLELEKEFSHKMVESEKKIADLEEKCSEYISQIEESSQALDEMQKKYNDLKEEYYIYKSNTSQTVEQLRAVKERCASKVEELELAASEIELLKNEKIGAKTNLIGENTKLIKDFSIFEEISREPSLKIKNLTVYLTERNLKYEELESECKNFKENVSAETEGKKDWNEEVSAITKELDKSNLEIISLRKEKSDLEENFAKEKEEMLKEKSEIAKEKSVEFTAQWRNICIELEAEKSKVIELSSNCSKFAIENAKLLKDLKHYEEMYKLQSEEASKLLQVLENCELNSIDKIKLFYSSSYKNLKNLKEINRQILEKDNYKTTATSKRLQEETDIVSLLKKVSALVDPKLTSVDQRVPACQVHGVREYTED